MNRTAIYARVSTDGQTTDNQVEALKKIAEQRGWDVLEKPYIDHAKSGKAGRDERDALDRLLRDATKKKFDVVMFWSVDRLARSAGAAATMMSEFENLGIRQFYYQQSVDTSTPYGKAMVQMAAVFAELEHAIIRERIHAGLNRARAEGKRLGRAPLAAAKKRAVLELAAANPHLSIRDVSRETGVSAGKVHALLKAAEKADQ